MHGASRRPAVGIDLATGSVDLAGVRIQRVGLCCVQTRSIGWPVGRAVERGRIGARVTSYGGVADQTIDRVEPIEAAHDLACGGHERRDRRREPEYDDVGAR